MKSAKEFSREKVSQLEEKLSGTIKNTELSWGLLFLIAAGVFAFIKLMKFIFYFFN